jgi:GxxExxY protein
MLTTEDTESTEEFENNSLTDAIIGAAITVHRELGPGLLESVYEKCLALELTKSGFPVCSQKEIPLTYKGLALESGFRADLIVEDKVLIELKSVDQLLPIHTAQVLTILSSAGLPERPQNECSTPELLDPRMIAILVSSRSQRNFQ